jgi:hypothetical protein
MRDCGRASAESGLSLPCVNDAAVEFDSLDVAQRIHSNLSLR